jgi:hypothetical protein
MAEGVNVAGGHNPIHPGSLFGQEAGGLLIRPGASQVNFIVSSIDIAAKYNRPTLGSQLFAFVQERLIKGQFERYAAVVAAAVGKIAVKQRE